MELRAGFWSVQLDAIDSGAVKAYSSQPVIVEIQPGRVTSTKVSLEPNPTTFHITADTSLLFAAGHRPDRVTVTPSTATDGYGTEASMIVSSEKMVASTVLSAPAPNTVDLVFRAFAGNELLSRKVLTNYHAWPGETVYVAWEANASALGSGQLSLDVELVDLIDPPWALSAIYSSDRDRLVVEWNEPNDLPVEMTWYVVQVQASDDEPYVGVYASTETWAHLVPPEEWRGKTINVRVSVSTGRPRSIASEPVSVHIPLGTEMTGQIAFESD